ncbi:MAG: nitrogenase component 1 [Acetivibrio sp.]
MEQVVKKISTYSGDWAGVCSALYELGGMVVIHDASGCNSTYTTFDEPRWSQQNSMFYISGLAEMDAVLGNDEKLIKDVIEAAEKMNPIFIALVGSPIPSMLGTDLEGLAAYIEHQTKIPSFGFSTNGMECYVKGGALALEKLAMRFCEKKEKNKEENNVKSLNILGMTPLDFSICGNLEAMRTSFENMGYKIQSVWAMGSSLEELKKAAEAHVNVVVSTLGLRVAKYMKKQFHIPYVIGLPIGVKGEMQMKQLIKEADIKKENQYLTSQNGKIEEKILIIGEPIIAGAIRYCLKEDFDFKNVHVLCPLKIDSLLVEEGTYFEERDAFISEESKIEEKMEEYPIVIADPMYRPLLSGRKETLFISLPHEAFSSRIYREEAPVFIGNAFKQEIEKRWNKSIKGKD